MSYLAPTPNKPTFGLNALKLWLRGDITTPRFLLTENGSYIDHGGRDTFCLEELHRALHIAVLEISLKLDPELEYTATEAGGERYCICVDFEEFYEGRDAEVKSLVDLLPEQRDDVISVYDRDAVCEVLEQVRQEIGWLENQRRRLDCHMEVAVEMKRAKSRGRFVFRPLERGWRVGSAVTKDVEMLDGGEEEFEVAEDVERGMVEAEGRGGAVEEDRDMADGESEVCEENQKVKLDITEQRQKKMRKERLAQFKREADMGVGEADVDVEGEEGVKEKFDSPLIGPEEAGE